MPEWTLGDRRKEPYDGRKTTYFVEKSSRKSVGSEKRQSERTTILKEYGKELKILTSGEPIYSYS